MHADSLAEFCERKIADTLDLLREMVAINSFTENASGVNRLGEFTAAAFAPLGFEASFHPATHPAHGRHLVLDRRAGSEAPTIALVSHLDTVFTEEEEQCNEFFWRREGSRIYGPGTNDIKGGTALIHLMLGAFQAELPRIFEETNWMILLNACEEVISPDFRNLCRARLPANTVACLIFEVDGGASDDFSLVAARKGRATFSIEVEGRGAHAGSSHQNGANAVLELADLVGRVGRMTDYDQNLTVNVGSLHGGTVANRVPHFAQAGLEMRAFSGEIFADAKRTILACAGPGSVCSADGTAHHCQVRATLDGETGPWPPNGATNRLITLWQQAGRELHLRVGSEKRGGLSDGNVLWDLFPTMDGLGPRGENSHCSEQSPDGTKEQEWVDASSFVPKAVLNARGILKLLQK